MLCHIEPDVTGRGKNLWRPKITADWSETLLPGITHRLPNTARKKP